MRKTIDVKTLEQFSKIVRYISRIYGIKPHIVEYDCSSFIVYFNRDLIMELRGETISIRLKNMKLILPVNKIRALRDMTICSDEECLNKRQNYLFV